ncbi:MAG: DUF4288 domain-containing protein [Bacteroidia bacterium]|nr:DUF4288 domain-containing protein [Bacteroidia bacterium]
MKADLKWYLVKLVYQVVSDKGTHTPQFDEQLRLIRADELDWAREKAKILGQIGAFSFMHHNNHEVNWKFIDVVDICELCDIEDGTQIYSTREEPEDEPLNLSLINAKAQRVYDFTQ